MFGGRPRLAINTVARQIRPSVQLGLVEKRKDETADVEMENPVLRC
jgi:hypothetical protein